MTSLHIINPQHITWTYEDIDIAILGGIKLDGLDRLRVTLKIEYQGDAIRHNLDLYNDLQSERFIRKVAERFGIATSYIQSVLAKLTNELEAYRITEMEQQQSSLYPAPKKLTDAEHKAAQAFLQAPDLLNRINELIGRSGIMGEEQNRLLMYVIFSSRKREHPLHVVSLAASGTGKSHLQESVAALIPDEDKVEITVLSENAFYYFGQRELKHKLLLIEDLDGAQNVLYPLRELQSKKRISKAIAQRDKAGNTQTLHLTVEGPVSVAGCTTKEHIYEDNANRSFLIYLDDSKDQDMRIMERQRLSSAGLIDTVQEAETKNLLQNTQRLLQPVSVRNPYAPLLQLPQEVFKPRRTNKHYLDFIEAITFLKQYQRIQHADPSSGEIYIETSIEDIAEANKLIAPVLLRKSDDLNGATRNYLELIKSQLPAHSSFTNKSVSKDLRLPISTIKRYHLQLLQSGYIRITTPAAIPDKSFHYEIADAEEYQHLQNRISNALDEMLERISSNGQPIGSLSAHKGSEPMKSKTGKASGQRLTKPAKKDIPPKEKQ